ncbi:MAG: hypothetical protein RL685_4820 [Pseudomonadota bacterium]
MATLSRDALELRIFLALQCAERGVAPVEQAGTALALYDLVYNEPANRASTSRRLPWDYCGF